MRVDPHVVIPTGRLSSASRQANAMETSSLGSRAPAGRAGATSDEVRQGRDGSRLAFVKHCGANVEDPDPTKVFSMTKWHTDNPIPPLPALSAIRAVPSVGMFRTDGPARVALSVARAYSLKKLRIWAKKRAAEATATPSADRYDHDTPSDTRRPPGGDAVPVDSA